MTRILYIFLALFLMSSCVSRKKLTYLQDKGTALELDSLGLQKLNREVYRIQENDILNISVRSLKPELVEGFNIANSEQNVAGNSGDLLFYLTGYKVLSSGHVEMPVLGQVEVVGKTLDEIKDLIELKLNEYFTEAAVHVEVQLAGIRFTVVGDVTSPGKYVIYQNQANVFEALAMAGDITLVGNRSQIQIIRQYPEGVKFYELDLTDRSVVSDPRYFIQPNDVINVKPLAVKSYGLGTTGFATIASLITVLSSTLLIIVNLQNLN